VIANYGNYVESTPILKITDRTGAVVFTQNAHKENLVDPQYTYIVSNVLSDPNARALIFGFNSVLKASHPAAVKTGTTENYRDAWTVGYTPNLVTGVWMGNNDGSFMDSVAGSLGPAPIWRNFVEQAEARLGWEDFRVPAGIQQIIICRNNGLKSHGTATDVYPEVFSLSTVPTRFCDEIQKPPEVATPPAELIKDGTGGGTDVASPPAAPIIRPVVPPTVSIEGIKR
jgi:membrane peptidoglycan carboxypeptidase